MSSLPIWTLAVLLAGATRAENGSAKPAPAYDYLFVVDTSFSMAREKQALADTVSMLVRTGLAGRMREGETWGLWTFHEQVFAERFPAQHWSPQRSQALADQAARFLKGQRFQKQTRLDRAIPEILNAAKASKLLTVCLLSDGDSSIVGTPFDRDLNLFYKQHYRALHRARKPFITTFVALDGQFVASAVAAGSDGFKLPEALGLPATAHLTAPSAPIIANVLLPRNATVETNREPPQTRPAAEAARQTVPPSETRPPSAASSDPGAKPIRSVGEKIQAASLDETPRTNAAVATEIRTNVAVSSVAPPGIAQSAVVAATNREAPVQASVPAEQTNSPPQSSHASEATVSAPVTQRPASGLETQNALEQPALAAADTASTNRSPETVLAATGAPASGPTKFLIGGLALLLSAVSLLFWSIRSSRPRGGPSLISRSLDRDQSER